MGMSRILRNVSVTFKLLEKNAFYLSRTERKGNIAIPEMSAYHNSGGNKN